MSDGDRFGKAHIREVVENWALIRDAGDWARLATVAGVPLAGTAGRAG